MQVIQAERQNGKKVEGNFDHGEYGCGSQAFRCILKGADQLGVFL